MHPLAYLLGLRQAKVPYLGLGLLFSLPCLGLSLLNPDAGARFLILAAVALVVALPIYQARCHLGLLSSLRRSHCLEELLGSGLSASSCADEVTRFSVMELLRLTLPVLAVLTGGFFLDWRLLQDYGLGLILFLPTLLYLTALGSYTAFVQLSWTGSWRQRAQAMLRSLPLLLPAVGLALSGGGPLPTLLALVTALLIVRSLAGEALTRALREEPRGASRARHRNRWVAPWSDNPIVIRETWRRSSVPGGLSGYMGLRYLSILAPCLWVQLVHQHPTQGFFWGGLALLGLLHFVRAAQRTLVAVVAEREQATWDTLAQTGLPLRTFVTGWLQVSAFPLWLEVVPLTCVAMAMAWARPGVVLGTQLQPDPSVALALGAGLAIAALTATGALVGLALSSGSRSLRQATARLVGVIATGLVAWMVSWFITSIGLESAGYYGVLNPDGIWWELSVQVLSPLATLLGLCLLTGQTAWRAIFFHLSLEEPAPGWCRVGLGPVGALLGAVVAAASLRDASLQLTLGAAMILGLAGLAGALLVEWWWHPLLGAWRGQPRVVWLSALLGGGLGLIAAAPTMLTSWLRGGGLFFELVTRHPGPQWGPGLPLMALLTGTLLGALCALPDLDLPPAPGGRLRRRTLVVVLLALISLVLVSG